MPRLTAVYLRLGGRRRGGADQTADLQRWAGDQPAPVTWYRDDYVGASADRPSFDRLHGDIEARAVGRVVVWRLDRLGLTPRGLAALFAACRRQRVDLVSLMDGWGLATPEGRLASAVLASLAAYDREPRSERVLAGQAAARERGQRWGGSAKGWRWKVTGEQEALILRLRREGHGVSACARATGLTRKTVYRVLEGAGQPPRRRKGGPGCRGAGSTAGAPAGWGDAGAPASGGVLPAGSGG